MSPASPRTPAGSGGHALGARETPGGALPGRESQPLRNVRVLDIASFMAAPMAAMWLGDFGADVIKVEHPKGDMMRTWGSMRGGVPLFWKMVGRNKRTIAIDLHREEGQELVRGLAEQVDVVVENFRPGTLAKWGLDYSHLSEINPGLVLLSISAFGQSGPYSPRPGFGTLGEAMSGYAHMTGQADGPPTLPSFGLADGITGLCGAFAVMVALHERDTLSGRGQHIDLAIYEPIMTVMGHQFVEYDQLGIIAQRMGSRLPFAAPRNAFLGGDGKWVAMSSSSQSVFERACSAIGRPELVNDPRYHNNQARTRNADALDAIFAEWIRARPAQEAIDTLNNAGAAAAPVYDISDIFSDPHFQARENVARVPDPELGQVGMQNVVPRLSRTPGRIVHAGPKLGQHTDEILGGLLGLDAARAKDLRDKGVIK